MSSITLNSGTGGASLGTDQVAGAPNVDYQVVKIGYSVAGSAPTQVSTTNPLPISDAGGSLTVDGAVTVSGTVTANIGTSGSLALDASVTGLQVAQGSTTSGQNGSLILGAVTTAAPTYTTAQTNALSLDTAGALRVNITAGGIASGTAGSPSADVVSVQGVSGGTAVPISDNSGSLTVDGTVTANLAPVTSGGLSVATGSIGATATAVKASAGQVYGWYFYNPNSSVAYVQFFNVAAASVTLGTTTPAYSLGIPAASGANVEIGNGIAHSTAISIGITTTRAGSIGPTSTVDYNVFYK